MATTRSKRWNGNFDTLPVPYLKDVLAKMEDYGDRVQFSLVTGGAHPNYQLTNELGKKMAFDKGHHLFHPTGDEFVGANASPSYTKDQVKAAIAGLSVSSGAALRGARVARTGTATRTSAAKAHDQFATQRYEYFKNNRQALPPTITQYSEEILDLMKLGKPAEEAFSEVVKKYY